MTLRCVGTTESLLLPNNDPALINIAIRHAIERSRLGFVASAGGGGSIKYLREGSERALTAGPASGCALRTGVQFSIDSVGSRLFLAVEPAACFELAVGARENDDVASYLIRLLHLDPRNPRLGRSTTTRRSASSRRRSSRSCTGRAVPAGPPRE